jgi:hypothetical protein
MKKTFAAALSTTLVLGFAGAALAVHGEVPAETSSVVAKKDVTVAIDGSIRSRGFINKDQVLDSNSATGYDGRVRLGVAAKVGDAVNGYVQLETGDGKDDNYNWGATAADPRNGGTKGSSTANLDILQAWINYNPGMFGVKVGHMPLSIANNVFYDQLGSGNDAIYAYMTPKNMELGFLTAKLAEGTTSAVDDTDLYSILYQGKLSDALTIGANFTNINNQAVTDHALYNVGAFVKGKAGNISYLLDVEAQAGSATTTSDYAGYAVKAEMTMKMGKNKLGVLVGYGSGEDNDADTTAFQSYQTDTHHETTIISYRTAVPYLGETGANISQNTSLTNLLLAQVNYSTNVVCPLTKKDLGLKARVSYVLLNEVPTGVEDDLGLEVDVFATWKLTSGLAYQVELAYLLSGDAYGANPDDAYFIRNGLELTF